jgi:NAD(P)-dependent dehydrogenase (short-subunit alcohol dehydrogenase family)
MDHSFDDAPTARRLQDRVALVTAAGSGMGRAIATRLAAEGAHTYVTDIDGDAAAAVAEQIASSGGAASSHALDAADTAAIESLMERVGGEHGKLHVLHNHAGIPGPGDLEISDEQFDQVMAVNMRSAYMATIAALPLLRAAAPRAVALFTSSVGSKSSGSSPVYGMSKAGLDTMTRSLAKRLGPEGIRFNAICPGFMDTPMLAHFVDRSGATSHAGARDKLQDGNLSTIPLRRLGRPDDIGAAAAFLASDDAAYITGIQLPVDGGFLA